jgi:hypothetical protein
MLLISKGERSVSGPRDQSVIGPCKHNVILSQKTAPARRLCASHVQVVTNPRNKYLAGITHALLNMKPCEEVRKAWKHPSLPIPNGAANIRAS